MKLEKLNWSRRRALTSIALVAALGCGKASSPQISSSSHWLRCDDDDDCTKVAAGAYCHDSGYCVDAEGERLSSTEPGSEIGAVPPAFSETRLPEGGTPASVELSLLNQFVVDESDVVWLSACEGLYAVQDDLIQRYTWLDSPLPEGTLQLLVDAQNRTWIFGYGKSLQVIEDGAFRTVFEGGMDLFALSRDGSAWVHGTAFPPGGSSRSWVRRVSPSVEDEIDTPEFNILSIAAGEPGVLWATSPRGVYRWADGAWSGPFIGEEATFVAYDPRQDVLWGGNYRLRWNGTSLEQERLLDDPSPNYGQQIGFDARGRLITVNDTAINWFSGGRVEQTAEVTGFDSMPSSAIGPGGEVYLGDPRGVLKHAGGELSAIAPAFSRFDPDERFSWRAQPFGQTLAAPSIELTGAQLASPNARTAGVKVHVVGNVFAVFEGAWLQVDGQVIPSTWVDGAPEFQTFMAERGLNVFINLDSSETQSPSGEEEPWDLYGYVETGTCFGHLESATRQFWIVEAYPVSMPLAERQELAAALRARNPVPAPQ